MRRMATKKGKRFLLGLDYFSLFGDTSDPEAAAKTKAIAGAGIDFVAVLYGCMLRPAYGRGMEFPWEKVKGNLWDDECYVDLARPNERLREHSLSLLDIAYCEGLFVELILGNDCTARREKMDWYFGKKNVNGVFIDTPECVRKTPSGAWQQVWDAHLAFSLPVINHPAVTAVRGSLEGTGSGAFEDYTRKKLIEMKVRKDIIWTTNTREGKTAKDVVYSPHVHTLAEAKRHCKEYGSDDGKYDHDDDSAAAYVGAFIDGGAPAFATDGNHVAACYWDCDARGWPKVRRDQQLRNSSKKHYRERGPRLTLEQHRTGEFGWVVGSMLERAGKLRKGRSSGLWSMV